VRILRFLFVLLLICSAATQVVAYRSGGTTQGSQLTTDQTASAVLAVTSTSPQFTALAGGSAAIDFRMAFSGTFGIDSAHTSLIALPASTVEMRDAFRVTNRSPNCQLVSVSVPGGGTPNLIAIKGRLGTTPPSGGTQLAGAGGTQTGAFSLAAGQTMPIDVRWTGNVGSVSNNFRILISSTQC
jgi:hypothetical protein